MKYQSMSFLIMSSASLAAFASEPQTPPKLSGTYTSGCQLAETIFNDGLAVKTAITFSDAEYTVRTLRYNDSLCLHEVDSDVKVAPFKVGKSMGIFNGFTTYTLTITIQDDNGEPSPIDMCFMLYPTKLSDKQKALYTGNIEETGVCTIDTGRAFFK